MFSTVIKETTGWIIIGLACAGIVYAGPIQDIGDGNPRPVVPVPLEQYKRDLQALGRNLDYKFNEIENRLLDCEAKSK